MSLTTRRVMRDLCTSATINIVIFVEAGVFPKIQKYLWNKQVEKETIVAKSEPSLAPPQQDEQ